MKRVAILGAGSFLAGNFLKYIEEYKRNEMEFICYGHSPAYRFDFIPKRKLYYQQIDFSDVESVQKINFCVDVVIIFIGLTGTLKSFEKYQDFIEINETCLLRILNAYVESGSRARIIYPGSRLIFRSNENELINEDSPRETRSIYAVNKQAAEDYLRIYNNRYNIDYVILRIVTPVGSIINSDGTYGTFEIFRNQAREEHEVTIFGDGSDRKTYSHILDICEAFYRLCVAKEIEFREYNLGGQILTMNEAVSHIVKDMNANIRHTEWPKDYLVVDGGTIMFDSSRFDKEFSMDYHKIVDSKQAFDV